MATQKVPTLDGSGKVRDKHLPTRLSDGSLNATYVGLAQLASDPFAMASGAITRDANGAATSFNVVWPDGITGVYTADTVSAAFPGAVDAYHVTRASTPAKTYTQPLVTRNSNGDIITRPAMTVV